MAGVHDTEFQLPKTDFGVAACACKWTHSDQEIWLGTCYPTKPVYPPTC
ncbi:hypothetical protein OOU_Y34scaffold00217g12 [Pyricularia oryzae Y34]|uniref:Uncharacterized protein n=3 Tax=Pyricularia oryzae TaxID=318829 RepID=A0A4P7NM82_PYROR|nr:hypothetical protein OOU_Y34scaffold00217g12 [Pyricularia oryzae Y34]QBZ63325.1 hypothetical protein PoMZ_12223 [Pyricularia oryzae]